MLILAKHLHEFVHTCKQLTDCTEVFQSPPGEKKEDFRQLYRWILSLLLSYFICTRLNFGQILATNSHAPRGPLAVEPPEES